MAQVFALTGPRTTETNAFNPGSPSAVIHNFRIGRAQYQNATSTPEEAYSNYDSAGNLLQDIVMHNGSPQTSTYTYDTYGNRASSINPDGEKTYYSYSSAYQYVLLTNTTRVLTSTINATTSYRYDFLTAYLLVQEDPMAYNTGYAYDQIGRTTQITEPPVGGTSSQVNLYYADAAKSFSFSIFSCQVRCSTTELAPPPRYRKC